MSILPRRNVTAAAAEPLAANAIPDVWADPRLVPAQALLTQLRAGHTRLEREHERLQLARLLRDRKPEPRSITDSSHRSRLADLEGDVRIPPEKPPASDGANEAVRAALEALEGKPFSPPPSHQAQLAEIERRLEMLRLGINDQSQTVDAIRDDLTAEYSQRLQPAWNSLQLEMYRAAQELSRMYARVIDFRAAIVKAGIDWRPDLLPIPNVRAPLQLGFEAHFDSEISQWRRIIENRGIL